MSNPALACPSVHVSLFSRIVILFGTYIILSDPMITREVKGELPANRIGLSSFEIVTFLDLLQYDVSSRELSVSMKAVIRQRKHVMTCLRDSLD